jgi:hypothetical protein
MVSSHEAFGQQEAYPVHSGSGASTVAMVRNNVTVDPVAGESGFSHIEPIEEEPGQANEGAGPEGENGRQAWLAAVEAVSDEGRIFERFVTYKACQEPWAVAIGDINGDGRTDAALTCFSYSFVNRGGLYVFLQDKKGRMKQSGWYRAGNGSSLDLADFNGDGKMDIALTAVNGIRVLHQIGSARFGEMVFYPSNHKSGTNAHKLKAGDFNHDGRQDVVSIDWGLGGGHAQEVDVYLQEPGGRLSSPVSYKVHHGGFDDLDVGDVNGDGLQDIIVMSGSGLYENIGVLLQTRKGTFRDALYYDTGSTLVAEALAVGDLNSDGLQDIASCIGGWLTVFFQDAFGASNIPVFLRLAGATDALEIADVDMDGRNDVIAVNSDYVRVFRQQITGAILGRRELHFMPGNLHLSNPHGLRIGDLNGDGANDIVIADGRGGGLGVFYNAYYDVSVVEPNGGEEWPVGSRHTIRWKTRAKGNVAVDISRDGGATWRTLFRNIPNTGKIEWKVGKPASDTARIRVRSITQPDNQDISKADFTISDS